MIRCLFLCMLFGVMFTPQALAEIPQAFPTPSHVNVEGRTVFLRVYEAGAEDPSSYTGVELQVHDDRLDLTGPEFPGDAMIALVRWDQPDQELLLGRGSTDIYIFPEKRVARFPQTFDQPSKPRELVLDGMAQAIRASDVAVTVLFGRLSEENEVPDAAAVRQIRIKNLPLDDQGQLRAPRITAMNPGWPDPRLSEQEMADRWHIITGKYYTIPGYGEAFAKHYFEPNEPHLRVPLVPRDSADYARALRGRLLDPQGRPLPHAVVQCDVARTGAGGAVAARDSRVVTDAQGEFALFLSGEMDPITSVSPPTPQGAVYYYQAWPPHARRLMPVMGEASNDQPVAIQFAAGETLKQMAFFDQAGKPVLPAGPREKIVVRYSKPDGLAQLTLPRTYTDNGAYLLPGRYEARLDGKKPSLDFMPVNYAGETSPTLIFKMPSAVSYTGRVIDGLTSQPLAGALVFAMDVTRSGKNLTALDDAAWDALDALTSPIDLNSEALRPLSECYEFGAIARTAADGSYELNPAAGREPYSIFFMARGRLIRNGRVHGMQADGAQRVELPDMQLYPRAEARLSAEFADANLPNARFGVVWSIDVDQAPAWAGAMMRPTWVPWQFVQHVFSNSLRPGAEAHTFDIPAGVPISIRVYVENEEADRVDLPNLVQAHPGQRFELGHVVIPMRKMIGISIYDRAQRPVEALPLGLLDGEGWQMRLHTDIHGNAFCFAPVGRTVYVGSPQLKENPRRIQVDLKGSDDDVDVFSITFTDEEIAQIKRLP